MNLEELTKKIGKDDVDKIVMEYFLLLVAKSNKLDEIAKNIDKLTKDEIKELL